MTFQILGVGHALPETAVSNADFIAEYALDTTPEWIESRTGITQRYVVNEHETTATLAAEAAMRACHMAGVDAADIDGVIVATCTPDVTFPSVATMVQQALGLKVGGLALDINAACSGFINGLQVAQGWLATGAAEHILVVGAESFSKMIDTEDRTTAVLFGDGAGAVLVNKGDNLKGIATGADGTYGPDLYADGGVGTTQDAGYVRMNGREVFKHAVRQMGAGDLLQTLEMPAEQVDWLVPHQANARILTAAAKALGIPPEKVIMTVAEHANTSAASIPLALSVAAEDGRIQRGQTLYLQAFGAGFTWGEALLTY